MDRLIVNINVGLRQKPDKALRDAQLGGGIPCVLYPTGTPEIELHSLGVKSPHLVNN